MPIKEYRSPFPDLDLVQSDLLQYTFSNPNGCARDKPIYVDALTGESRTYEDVIHRSKCLATVLSNLGIGRGDVVTVFSPNTIDYPIYCFGILGVGAIVSTANFALTAHELRDHLQVAKSSMVIAHSSLLSKARKSAQGTLVRSVVRTDGTGLPNASLEMLLSDAQPSELYSIANHEAQDKIAFLCFSSGTTGAAKGVELTHYNLSSNIQQNCAVSEDQYIGRSTFVGFLPFSHTYGFSYFVLLSMYSGSTVVVMQKFDFNLYLRVVETHKVDVLHVVPPTVLQLTKSPAVAKFKLHHIKRVFSAAAPLSRELREAFEAKFKSNGVDVDCYQAWGLTETSPLATQVPFSRKDKKDTVGCIVPNMSFRLVDLETLQDVSGQNAAGEIWCKGPNVTRGYYRNPTATKDSITAEGWFRTGDIGVADSEGYFKIVDRIKEMFKYKGMQVIPSELEGKLITHPYVDDAAVLGIFSDVWASDLPTAFIVLSHAAASQNRQAVIEEINKWFNNHVANHKKLRGGIHVVESIPKTSSGKILRRQLSLKGKSTLLRAKL